MSIEPDQIGKRSAAEASITKIKEPTWATFWNSVPLRIREQIDRGLLSGHEAILTCAQFSGTVIEDLDHPLARCLTEHEQTLLRKNQGTVTVGVGNAFRFFTPRRTR